LDWLRTPTRISSSVLPVGVRVNLMVRDRSRSVGLNWNSMLWVSLLPSMYDSLPIVSWTWVLNESAGSGVFGGGASLTRTRFSLLCGSGGIANPFFECGHQCVGDLRARRMARGFAPQVHAQRLDLDRRGSARVRPAGLPADLERGEPGRELARHVVAEPVRVE